MRHRVPDPQDSEMHRRAAGDAQRLSAAEALLFIAIISLALWEAVTPSLWSLGALVLTWASKLDSATALAALF